MSSTVGHFSEESLAVAKQIAEERNADLYLYSAPIHRANASAFCGQLARIQPKRPNACLILTTHGGDPDAAFLIGRCLQRHYGGFSVLIFGPCKSAGTLVVIGAKEVVVADSGELGPLDIQIGKEDELFIRSSGLDITESIVYLRDLASELFLNQFVRLKAGSSITTKTAAEIAQGIALGVVGPIIAQIDPIKLGEVQRSMNIAKHYGKILNPSFSELDSLVTGYPSHSFVIDREQAKRIFQNVRPPSDKEDRLNQLLRNVVEDDKDIIEFLTPPSATANEVTATPTPSPNAQPNGHSPGGPDGEPIPASTPAASATRRRH